MVGGIRDIGDQLASTPDSAPEEKLGCHVSNHPPNRPHTTFHPDEIYIRQDKNRAGRDKGEWRYWQPGPVIIYHSCDILLDVEYNTFRDGSARTVIDLWQDPTSIVLISQYDGPVAFKPDTIWLEYNKKVI